MSGRLEAEHGIVCRLGNDRFGYFGWPTVARMDDGTLVVACSGMRSAHVCPWGRTVILFSRDDGKTWTPPRVINDGPIDDRDVGVLCLGGRKLLVSWFTIDSRPFLSDSMSPDLRASWEPTISAWTDEVLKKWLGSWIMLSDDGGITWSAPLRAPVSSPHGPIRLRGGELLYLGKDCTELAVGPILAARSADGGRTWSVVSEVPLIPGTNRKSYHEPHVVELPSGKLVGAIRLQNYGPDADVTKLGLIDFSIVQTDSADGGRTWSMPTPLFYGSPPHLLRHSSGALVMCYGYRRPPCGQRAAFSRDDGASWDHDWIIRDDGPNGDLGYPSTLEMGDGSLFTACYQAVPGDAKCSLLWSRWRLP